MGIVEKSVETAYEALLEFLNIRCDRKSGVCRARFTVQGKRREFDVVIECDEEGECRAYVI
jgi:hypothetical protein